jgi:fumarylacetoacetase
MLELDETHDSKRRSWVASANAPDAEFPIQNLPFGVFSTRGGAKTGGVAIGDCVIDLKRCADLKIFSGDAEIAARDASAPTLNALLKLGRGPARALRRQLADLLDAANEGKSELAAQRAELLHPLAQCELHLPTAVGNYTDFYAGIHHARTVGAIMMRENPLPENYRWVPIAYHGRASSVGVSGDHFPRPNGQIRPDPKNDPVFEPCRRLDLELEMGFFVSGGNAVGEPIPVAKAADEIFGYCLLNDWSARDVQTWEMIPLGPFLAKNFRTTISPWIVTADALLPFRCGAMHRDETEPKPLPYLTDTEDQTSGALDIDLEVLMRSSRMRAEKKLAECVIRSNAKYLYWTPAQMIAHHTSGGCNLLSGDLIGTGTISGPDKSQLSSLLELTAGGRDPFTLSTGETRTFIEDGDEITLRGRCRKAGFVSIGFGDCTGTVEPARQVK